MTSYCMPSHSIKLAEIYQLPSSCMWAGKLKLEGKQYLLDAMLLLSNDPSADLWLCSKHAKVEQGSMAIFTLKEMDPYWQIESHYFPLLKPFIGVEVRGEIYAIGAMPL
ncbi:hypothetical protein [Motilimonas sp. E26]|uniref:hypothetical protein n=1 Tax=Motilimonas sp. E26 TaxID=2865674 RepID=UPI001E3A71E5|nr:hypothetical protein [Motilimonas sp. E26]MCE0555464.1 hypothetical protein [Motilimonas sp. E26]